MNEKVYHLVFIVTYGSTFNRIYQKTNWVKVVNKLKKEILKILRLVNVCVVFVLENYKKC